MYQRTHLTVTRTQAFSVKAATINKNQPRARALTIEASTKKVRQAIRTTFMATTLKVPNILTTKQGVIAPLNRSVPKKKCSKQWPNLSTIILNNSCQVGAIRRRHYPRFKSSKIVSCSGQLTQHQRARTERVNECLYRGEITCSSIITLEAIRLLTSLFGLTLRTTLCQMSYVRRKPRRSFQTLRILSLQEDNKLINEFKRANFDHQLTLCYIHNSTFFNLQTKL